MTGVQSDCGGIDALGDLRRPVTDDLQQLAHPQGRGDAGVASPDDDDLHPIALRSRTIGARASA
jgi:hypothetical protein